MATVDKLLIDITKYVNNKNFINTINKETLQTAKYCLLDSIGCALGALKFNEPKDFIKPYFIDNNINNNINKDFRNNHNKLGCNIIGTNYFMDPTQASLRNGSLIRWLDFNDCWLAKEWGHPSDNLGSILTIANYIENFNEKSITIDRILVSMIKAHEIQGILSLNNSLNSNGYDHTFLVKLSSAAVTGELLDCTDNQILEILAHIFTDGPTLRIYRHSPNTISRKSWAAGDACSRAVQLALMVQNGNINGMLSNVLTNKKWGFNDTFNNGNELIIDPKFKFDTYVMDNILFKISFPAEFHAQTAIECSLELLKILNQLNKTTDDIKLIKIKTQKSAMEIINKTGSLKTYADRDHCIQYMVAATLTYGNLTANHYLHSMAQNPKIDSLRKKMVCEEDPIFTSDYYDPSKRSIGNSLTVELKDGTQLDEIRINYPIGHKFRRDEGIPLLCKKFENHLSDHFHNDQEKTKNVLSKVNSDEFYKMTINQFLKLFIPENSG